ncbi:MAG: hemerythrin domain-containing protein [Burkholderiales bacterium]|nr:hemerythrin domain-containing protein [Burkholderiales bacterium]MDE2394841.1 hemerythrin domain-containing protein [Burkholderiales bacterium]
MGLAFPGHSAPGAGFEVPLEMLGACHRRVESQCQTLRRLAEHLARHGADADARTAAAAIKRYFETSALDHHADEEVDLFPALLESMAGSDPVCLRELTAALTADHRELERRWRALKRPLDALVAGRAAALDAAEVEAFVGLYARHIEREEAELLPMAERLIGAAELDRIGRAMRERRGV